MWNSEKYGVKVRSIKQTIIKKTMAINILMVSPEQIPLPGRRGFQMVQPVL